MPLGAIEAHMKRERSAPPPPTPSLITGWREAEEAFARSGIDQSALLVRIARERGLTPAEALALAGYFAAHAAANEWGAGVLFTRVRNALPGAAVEARWMPPSPAAQARARMARSAEQRDRRARESAAYGIIRAMRTQQRADDAQIRAELAARGLAWPGEAALTHTLTE